MGPGRRVARALAIFVGCLTATPAAVAPAAAVSPGGSNSAPAAKAPARVSVGSLGVRFERNIGQADPAVQFLGRGPQGLVLTYGQSWDVLAQGPNHSPARISTELVGARRIKPAARHKLSGITNYAEPAPGKPAINGIRSYGEVIYRKVYPGIDLIFHGSAKSLEYDFRVHPGASPNRIRMRLRGAHLSITKAGDLLIKKDGATLRQPRPVIYQIFKGRRVPATGEYVLSAGSTVGFSVGKYDRRRPLVIDPLIAYSTYLGGTADDGLSGFKVDAQGAMFAAGDTISATFPRADNSTPVNSDNVNTADPESTVGRLRGSVAYVMKLDPTGQKLEYITFLKADSSITSMILNLTGVLTMENTLKYRPGGFSPGIESHLAQLDSAGGATYKHSFEIPDNSSVEIRLGALSKDAAGNIYTAGGILSEYCPPTGPCRWGPVDHTSTQDTAYMPEPTYGTSSGYFAKLNPVSFEISYGSYFSGVDGVAGINSAVADRDGNLFVGGTTAAETGVATPGAFRTHVHKYPDCDNDSHGATHEQQKSCSGEAFIAKFNPNRPGKDGLIWSTYLGGTSSDSVSALAVDGAGRVFATGQL
ncbi:MAG: SBBP repeat-containing protein, partial [Actinomycetota bacterium]